MKSKILLIVIYLAFISLGLPDGTYGVSWPTMRTEFNKPLETAGIISLILTICSAISSIISGKLQFYIGTGKIVLFSCITTGISLLCISVIPSFIFIYLIMIPLGFGQGAVDSCLNNYVAKNYTSLHMNWLHSFWGVGASLGPFIFTLTLANNNSWRNGYLIIGIIQLLIGSLLLFSIKYWKTNTTKNTTFEAETNKSKISKIKSTPAVAGIIIFFFYAGIEFSVGLWAYSLFVESRNIPKETAGFWISLYYTSLTIGRFISGIIVKKFGNRNLIRIGFTISTLGILLILMFSNNITNFAGILLLGFGFAPLYPCMAHEVPKRFSINISDTLIGYQVGAAMLGASIVPASIGLIISISSLEFLMPIILIILFIMLLMSEYQNKLT